MARREGGFRRLLFIVVQLSRVPRGYNQAPAIGLIGIFYFIYHLGDLVYRVAAGSLPTSPLHTVDAPKISVVRTVRFPVVSVKVCGPNSFFSAIEFTKACVVARPLQKPQQLALHCFKCKFLGGYRRETISHVEAHMDAKKRARPCAGAVATVSTLLHYLSKRIKILSLHIGYIVARMNKGVFIAIEGGDGSGKSSVVAWLKQELGEEKFLFTREPGGTDAAEEIREVLVKHREQDLEVLTQLFLFEAGRTEHVVKKIRPALESGRHVVTDRFSASSFAYQVVAGGAPHLKAFFEMADALARGGLTPDLTLFLDVSPEVGLARKGTSGDALNTFDKKDMAFYVNVRRGVKEYLADKPHVIIDAEKPQQNVREEIKKIILEHTK